MITLVMKDYDDIAPWPAAMLSLKVSPSGWIAICQVFAKNAVALGHTVLPLDTTTGGGSTDMGIVSQVIPAIHPFVKIGDPSLTPHTREFQETACTDGAHQGMLDGAKMLAMTAIDVWTDPDLLRQVQEEFARSRQA